MVKIQELKTYRCVNIDKKTVDMFMLKHHEGAVGYIAIDTNIISISDIHINHVYYDCKNDFFIKILEIDYDNQKIKAEHNSDILIYGFDDINSLRDEYGYIRVSNYKDDLYENEELKNEKNDFLNSLSRSDGYFSKIDDEYGLPKSDKSEKLTREIVYYKAFKKGNEHAYSDVERLKFEIKNFNEYLKNNDNKDFDDLLNHYFDNDRIETIYYSYL